MTRDDIIRMAHEAQGTSIPSLNNETIHFGFLTEELERFAALVAAHEREACAKLCDEFVKNWDVYGHLAEGADECAKAIRARGETP